MRVLVTGGAGFIGSHLSDRLIEQGASVIVVDNLITGRLENISQLMNHPNFTFIEHDVIEPFDAEVDRIYHLASPASPEGYMRHPIETHLVNSVGTLNMLRLALRQDARILYTSTSEAYGDPMVHPQPETYNGNVNPVGPRSCYDESKRFGESITMEFVRQFDLDARIVRIFNTYGPRNDPLDGRVVPNFIMRALSGQDLPIYGDGMQTRALCYVEDLVAGLQAVMNSDAARGQVINLGNPDERTVADLAAIILELCDSSSTLEYLPARPDDPYKRRPDITKAQSLVGWTPRVPIQDGMRRTIDYFREFALKDAGAARVD